MSGKAARKAKRSKRSAGVRSCGCVFCDLNCCEPGLCTLPREDTA